MWYGSHDGGPLVIHARSDPANGRCGASYSGYEAPLPSSLPGAHVASAPVQASDLLGLGVALIAAPEGGPGILAYEPSTAPAGRSRPAATCAPGWRSTCCLFQRSHLRCCGRRSSQRRLPRKSLPLTVAPVELSTMPRSNPRTRLRSISRSEPVFMPVPVRPAARCRRRPLNRRPLCLDSRRR